MSEFYGALPWAREWPDEPELECGNCGEWMPIALWQDHMLQRHGIAITVDLSDMPITDQTGETDN